MYTKIRENESKRQAQRFTAVNAIYVKEGLCFKCSAQAAYGHQHGFTQVHAPCAGCAEIVMNLPHATSVPEWRKVKHTV